VYNIEELRLMLNYLMNNGLSFRDACSQFKLTQDRLRFFKSGEINEISQSSLKRIENEFKRFTAQQTLKNIKKSDER